jgi:tetratricopeptide (TPR) repeat protein
MEIVRLRYHAPPGPDDGYRGAVRDLLVPWNDTRDGIETRLTRWIARDRDQEPGEVHEEAETLARWCGYLREGEPPVSDAVGLAYLYRYLDTRVWRGGACVVLEDAHNAQAAGDGLAIAEAILDRTVGERPVLVLCTLSAEALQSDPAVRRKVDALLERGARRIGLRRLGLTDTRRVVDESLLLDPELARAVALECEGAPLAAGLLLREWASREALVPDARGRFALRKGASLQDEIPSGVDALVRRRIQSALDRSPETAAADALALTALAGQEPPASLVRAIADAGLDTLLTTGLVAEQRGALVFEHSSVHAMAIERAAKLPHRKELHAKLATAWQELGERTGLDVDPHVGMHRLRSGDPDGALGPLLAAARTMTLGGRARDAIRAAALAIEAADATSQPAGQLEARRLHAEALVEAGEPARGAPLLTYALRGGEGDRLGRARLRLALGRAARKTGDHETAHRELEGAWAAFDALRDRIGLLSAATQRAKQLRAEGRHHLAATHWADVLRLNRGDLTVEAEALNGLVEALILEGRLENVDREALRLQRVSRASGDTRRVAEAAATMGILCLVRDAHDEAERHLVAASATAATLGADRLHARCRMLLGRVYRRRHRLDDAEDVASWLVRFASERGMHVTEAEGRVDLAHVWLERGDHARAAEALEAGARALEGTPRHGLWVQVSLLHALLAAERDDEAACVAAWERAREHGLDPSAPPRDVWPIVDTLGRTVMVRAWRTMAARLADRGHDDTEEAVMIDE